MAGAEIDGGISLVRGVSTVRDERYLVVLVVEVVVADVDSFAAAVSVPAARVRALDGVAAHVAAVDHAALMAPAAAGYVVVEGPLGAGARCGPVLLLTVVHVRAVPGRGPGLAVPVGTGAVADVADHAADAAEGL